MRSSAQGRGPRRPFGPPRAHRASLFINRYKSSRAAGPGSRRGAGLLWGAESPASPAAQSAAPGPPPGLGVQVPSSAQRWVCPAPLSTRSGARAARVPSPHARGSPLANFLTRAGPHQLWSPGPRRARARKRAPGRHLPPPGTVRARAPGVGDCSARVLGAEAGRVAWLGSRRDRSLGGRPESRGASGCAHKAVPGPLRGHSPPGQPPEQQRLPGTDLGD